MVRIKTAPAVKTAAKTAMKEASEETTSPAGAKPRVRDRIFDTACEMFYKHGIRDVGVDAIANEAGTNKMSFYRSFPSKDELIAEYLRDQAAQSWEWWDQVVAPYEGDPRRQIEALFDAYVVKVCDQNSRGSALANVAVEIPECNHPGRRVALEAKIEKRRRYAALAKAAGVKKYEELGDALMLLGEGGYFSRLTFSCNNGPVRNAGKIVRTLLDAYGAKYAK
jgi:AcrR family transcriptional regulator